MIRSLIFAAAALGAGPALAQQAETASGATLRMLDRVTGQLEDVNLTSGASAKVGQLSVSLDECRYPSGNPSGDAFAYLRIADDINAQEIFSGWMVASAPALNALDHARYDVWVIRCSTS